MSQKRASELGAATPVSFSGFCAPQARKYVLVAAILASALGFIDGTVVAAGRDGWQLSAERSVVVVVVLAWTVFEGASP